MLHEILFRVLSTYRQITIIAAAVIPVATLLVSFLHGVYDGRRAPWRQFYAFMVHLLTLAVAAAAAMVVYHILDGGSLDDAVVPIIPIVVLAAAWLLTIAFVKRAVDFSMIRTVRNPFGLLFSWLIAWGVAIVVAATGFWFIPGPQYITAPLLVLVVFLVIRLIARLIFGGQEQD